MDVMYRKISYLLKCYSGHFVTLGRRASQIGSLAKGIASSTRGRWKREGEGKTATGITSRYIVSFF